MASTPRYAKTSDILVPDSTLISLTNEDNTAATTINEENLIKALDHGQSEADSFIGAKYKTPLEIVIPIFLKQIVVRLAVYFLYLNKGQKIPEDVKEDYEKAMQALNDIANGKRTLGAPTVDQSSAAGSTTVPRGRT